ncbi:MAG TPA: glycosyltransferase, partial [bacterium]|nr:glycosyltransferase [bacterium]
MSKIEMNGLSVIILNYNGYKLIERLLNSLLKHLKNIEDDYEILIIDDNSSNDDVSKIHRNFPNCRIVSVFENNGFVKNSNRAARLAKFDKLLFLNNDMELIKFDWQSIKEKIIKPEVFAVSPKILRPYFNYRNETVTVFLFDNGFMQSENVNLHFDEDLFDKEMNIGWVCGGCMFVEKKKFLDIGGFDENFAPIYVEDVDISYRAYLQGMVCLYLPNTIFYHYANSTMKNLLAMERLEFLTIRNKFLLFWKNIRTLRFWFWHLFFIFKIFITFDYLKVKAFVEALKKLPNLKFTKIKNNITDDYISKIINADILLEMLPLNIKKIYKLKPRAKWKLYDCYLSLPDELKIIIKKYLEEYLGYCLTPPKKLTICPGSICNFECPLCPVGMKDNGRPKKLLDFKLLKKIIDELADTLEAIDLYNWGEPFLNPDLPEMIRYIKFANPKIHIVVSTNGSINNEEFLEKIITSGLDELWFSIDGADQQSLEIYRRKSNFSNVLKTLKICCELKKKFNSKINLQWRFHIMRHNEHLIDKARAMAESLGVEFFAAIIRTHMGKELIELIET